MEPAPQSDNSPGDAAPASLQNAWYEPLHKVTILSKVTAAIVFVTLPFVGFYLGYASAPGGQVTINQKAGTADTHNYEVAGNQLEKSGLNDLGAAVWSNDSAMDQVDRQPEPPEMYTDMNSLQAVLSGNEALLEPLTTQYEQGFKRLINHAATTSLSDYVALNGDIYYSPFTLGEQVSVSPPQLVVRDAEGFKDEGYSLAHYGGNLYYRGEIIASTTYFAKVGHQVYVSDTTLYNLSNHDRTDPTATMVAFEQVRGEDLRPVTEFHDSSYENYIFPVLDSSYSPRWYRDGEHFYCVAGTGVPNNAKLLEPVRVVFTPSGTTTNSWIRAGVTGQVSFFETRTGVSYNTQCEPIQFVPRQMSCSTSGCQNRSTQIVL